MNIDTKVINGQKIASIIKDQIKDVINQAYPETVGLAVISLGNDEASQIYVRNKQKACDYVGIKSQIYNFEANTPLEDILELIDVLNNSHSVDGILIQLPLPAHINPRDLISAIDFKKDVDGFSKESLAGLITGDTVFKSCTSLGIIELLKYEKIKISGKKCVVVGRSNIVGKPLALMLLNEDATVSICHSKTDNLIDEIKTADILITAIGQPKFITGDMIKPGAVVIDVGINRDINQKLCGDVDFDSCFGIAGYITPVPGGVGPMTVAMLLKNCLTAANLKI
ncbi:MAG: bifunctional methylenetetrahydrofolate dehydrogenase/methenyltetrahydrofolate cyclohydrolase [Candidatus Epulonipiscioides saccharophilum]|nr:MAG: bifunctional methylenetetrahydrofolate dehydrogenase/methenyltetrahydrofolate cyclohydrolase [Epulopiscium sp. AS2M-Bin001]